VVAVGGAGPMFTCEVAEQLEIERIVVPPAAGLLSSLGLLLAEPLHDSVRTVLKDAGDVNPGELETIFRKMEGKAANLLHKEGVKQSDVKYQRLLEMRYQGQSYELPVPLLGRAVTRGMVRSAVQGFHRIHQTKYGYSQPGRPVEIVNVRSYCRGKAGTVARVTGRLAREEGLPKSRRVWFMDGHGIECRVLLRDTLRLGTKGKGPCVIEGVIVLVVIEAVVLGFPGISQNISGSTISIANIVVFMIGLVVALIVFKFGTQLAKAVSDAYKNYQAWVPLLAYIFQIIAIVI